MHIYANMLLCCKAYNIAFHIHAKRHYGTYLLADSEVGRKSAKEAER